MTKTCKRCKLELDVSRFGTTKARGKTYLRGVCKDCTNRNVGAAPKPAADPVEAIDITVDPLAAAEHHYTAAAEKRDLKKEHSALFEENVRLKKLVTELGKVRPPDILVYEKPKHERADAIACAIASDWHVEEPVTKEHVHGVNEYNLEIAAARSEQFFKNVLRLTNIFGKDSIIKQIHLALLGDFFSGWIHEELIANTLLAPGRAANFVQQLLVSGIQYLLDNGPYDIVGDAIPGNHGRMTHHVHIGDPTGTSLETFMYHHVVDHFHGNPRVRINVSDQAMVYRVMHEKFVLRQIHGYEVKYGGGVGGINIPLNKKVAQWDTLRPASLTILGHFHQFLPGQRTLVNGSLIGYNTFAQTIGAAYEEPKQAFYLVHARGGGQVAGINPVWLDKR